MPYDENSIRQLNWRDAIRNSIGMYISNADVSGMHHLLEEIVSNAMDEAAAGYGDVIKVDIDTVRNQATVIDNGRGVPFRKNKDGQYAILSVYQGLHAGGKFEGDTAYKSALGLNGVGGAVTNALSRLMVVRSRREDGSCIISFENGEGTPEITDRPCSNTGTSVSFIPDPDVFKNIKWDIDLIKEKLQYHALLNNGIRFILYVNGQEVANYLYSNGIKDMLTLKAQGEKVLTKPIYNKVEIAKGTPDEFVVEYAFQYIDKPGEHFYAFTNGGYNPDEGTHVTGFRSGFTSLINKKAKELEYIKEGENFDGAIIRRGLLCILSVKMVQRPQFAEQTKLKLTSPEARTACSQAIGKLILSKAQAEEIIKKVQVEQKAEDAAKRAKAAAAKVVSGGKNLNTLRDMPEKLSDCPDRHGELFITEGDSASGNARIMRNKQNQAVLGLRGKILNTWSRDLADALESQEVKNILTALGCGVGDNFNINNLRYDKIIIFSDADPDGGHIQLLIEALFLKHLPKLIEAGKVYRVVPPLYRITNQRGTNYYYSEKEARNKVGERTHFKGLGEMAPQELYDTCLDPERRHLIQLKPDDIEADLLAFDTLMGKSAEKRRAFILSHKIKGEIGDTYEEEVE